MRVTSVQLYILLRADRNSMDDVGLSSNNGLRIGFLALTKCRWNLLLNFMNNYSETDPVSCMLKLSDGMVFFSCIVRLSDIFLLLPMIDIQESVLSRFLASFEIHPTHFTIILLSIIIKNIWLLEKQLIMESS